MPLTCFFPSVGATGEFTPEAMDGDNSRAWSIGGPSIIGLPCYVAPGGLYQRAPFGTAMNPATLKALAQFPQQLEAFYDAIPHEYKLWAPLSWDGIPSERFTALEQLCHIRDIEIEGYQLRIQRTLQEENPHLPSIESYELAKERDYAATSAADALDAFRKARTETVRVISGLRPEQLLRKATFQGYGPVTVQGLVHYLCSHDQQHLAGLQWLLGKIEA